MWNRSGKKCKNWNHRWMLWCIAFLITWLTSCVSVLTLYRCYFSAIKTKLSLYLRSHYFPTKTLKILATSSGIKVTCPEEKVQPVLKSKERVQHHSVLECKLFRPNGKFWPESGRMVDIFRAFGNQFFVVNNVPNAKKAANLPWPIGMLC